MPCRNVSVAGYRLADYRRPRHQSVARVLAALDAAFLESSRCYFGGGTRMALELDEYRESGGLDFLCADLNGYRSMRAAISEHSLGPILPKPSAGITLLRDVRADQYGIRTVLGVDGEPVKFEIILEARIALAPGHAWGIPVICLGQTSCFAEKWLANADRWIDSAVLSRDAVDLAFMLSAWNAADAHAGALLAERAYGAAIRRAAVGACTRLIEDAPYRKRCAEGLAIEDAKGLLLKLRKLARFAAQLK